MRRPGNSEIAISSRKTLESGQDRGTPHGGRRAISLESSHSARRSSGFRSDVIRRWVATRFRRLRDGSSMEPKTHSAPTVPLDYHLPALLASGSAGVQGNHDSSTADRLFLDREGGHDVPH